MSYVGTVKALDYGSGNAFNAALEATSRGLVVADLRASALISGQLFSYGDFQTLENAEVIELLVTTPAGSNLVGFSAEITTTGETTIDFFEAPTTSAVGTLETAYDLNRETANTPTVTVHSAPTVTADGTKIGTRSTGQGGAGRASIGGDLFGTGFILANDQTYLVRITSAAASNSINYSLIWTEYEPRT